MAGYTWYNDPYDINDLVDIDMEKINTNLGGLKVNFYGDTAPTNVANGMTWLDYSDATYYYVRVYINGWRNLIQIKKSDYTVKAVNSDLLDGYNAGNGSGNIPISNGTVNTNLNADLLDGQHGTFYRNASNLNTGSIPSTRIANNTVYATSLENGALYMPSTYAAETGFPPTNASYDLSHYATKIRLYVSAYQGSITFNGYFTKNYSGTLYIRLYCNGLTGSEDSLVPGETAGYLTSTVSLASLAGGQYLYVQAKGSTAAGTASDHTTFLFYWT